MAHGMIEALMAKAPPPDEMEGGPEDNPKEEAAEDEDGKSAAGRSAFNDFMRAIGQKPSDGAYEAFMDAVRYCK
jgi:hypothetical protein